MGRLFISPLAEPIMAETDILLVEDSEDDASFFTHALAAAQPSAQTTVARDGVEALLLLFGAENPERGVPTICPRIIVLDLKLPRMNGLELLRLLKTNPHSRSIPVVILSSSKEKRDLVESYQLGANSYLAKPMDFDEFAGLVRTLGRYWLECNLLQKI